jgi:hypothetical protein
MAETPAAEEFLRLEDATTQLLTELESLKKETVSFGDAHKTVASAAEKLGALSGSLTETTVEIGESARALREIGTPELLAKQARLEAQLDTVSKTLAHTYRLLQIVAVGIVVVAVIEIIAAFVRR